MKISKSMISLVGNTPLVSLPNISKTENVVANLVAKLEFMNPMSSVKDRLALALVEDAESRGLLNPNEPEKYTIVEPTSGNTGIGLAFIASVKGYKLTLTMPESMSEERKQLLRGLGANLVLTKAANGMKGAIAEAEKIVSETSGAVYLKQFINKANVIAHLKTGEEIWNDCDGNIDVFVAGVGTGGTVSGVGQFLKKKNPNIEIYAVEPLESPVLSNGQAGPHLIQGIGAGFVPEVLDRSVLDGVLQVASKDALSFARRLILEEGMLVGISSGAAGLAALNLAKDSKYANKRIVFIAPDSANRYLSTALFQG